MGAWPEGYTLREFSQIDSTNEEARRLAEAGEAGPIWLRADAQDAGKGRRGRNWVSDEGNLFATLMIRPQMKASAAALLSFAAALAVADVLDKYVDEKRITLKWPNDVQLDLKKVCGILLESTASYEGEVEWLAVGIGINLAHHPHLEAPKTVALADVADAPSVSDAMTDLAAAFDKWYRTYETRGFEALRSAWLLRAHGILEPITVRLPKETLTGTFNGIDETGALLLETTGGLWKITAGEVFFG